MNSLKNRVQLIGHLGGDPEIKKWDNGGVMARFSMATNEKYTNAKGEKIENTQWHNIVAKYKAAELVERLLRKGNEVAVTGKLTHRSWDDKEGITRYITEVEINEFFKITKEEQV